MDHPAGLGEATTVVAERAGGEGGEVPLPYVRTSTATLAAMPASELLDLVGCSVEAGSANEEREGMYKTTSSRGNDLCTSVCGDVLPERRRSS